MAGVGSKSRFQKGNTKARKDIRPKVQYCDDVTIAVNHRASVLREISLNLAKINDILLTEYQIRDLNDTINRLLRERRAWENRIKELGGPDYTKINSNLIKNTSSISINGNKYFGRAKELPDVVKLLKEAENEKKQINESDPEKRLSQFNDKSIWGPEYFTNSIKKEWLVPCSQSADSVGILGIKICKEMIPSDSEMEKLVMKEKKKLLLQKIRSKK